MEPMVTLRVVLESSNEYASVFSNPRSAVRGEAVVIPNFVEDRAL